MSEEPVVTTTDTTETTQEVEEQVVSETDQTEAQTTAESSEEVPVRVVPEADAYELPEGVPVEIGKFANENDMTQEQLSKTLETFGGIIQANDAASQTAIRAAGEELVSTWGDSSKLNLSLAKQSLSELDGDGKLTEVLKSSGYINHPAVLNFLYGVGKVMQEGGYIKSKVNVPKPKGDVAHILYPNDVPK